MFSWSHNVFSMNQEHLVSSCWPSVTRIVSEEMFPFSRKIYDSLCFFAPIIFSMNQRHLVSSESPADLRSGRLCLKKFPHFPERWFKVLASQSLFDFRHYMLVTFLLPATKFSYTTFYRSKNNFASFVVCHHLFDDLCIWPFQSSWWLCKSTLSLCLDYAIYL